MNPYEVLGVPVGATPEQVDSAFRTLAQIYHPDRYALSPEGVRAEAQKRMQDVLDARTLLKSKLGAAADARSNPNDGSRAGAAVYAGPSCLFCGHGPVAAVELRQSVGFILWRRVRSLEAEVCRGCGVAMFRDIQNRTLRTGWWGIISIFVNIWYVIGNLAHYRKISRLGFPSPTPMTMVSPLRVPLAPGKVLWQRSGLWIAGILAMFLVGIYTNIPEAKQPGELSVGDCLLLADLPRGDVAMVTNSSCSAAGVGEVFALSSYPLGEQDAYPGDVAIERFAQESCSLAAEYGGVLYFTPTKSGWEAGDHQVICVYELAE